MNSHTTHFTAAIMAILFCITNQQAFTVGSDQIQNSDTQVEKPAGFMSSPLPMIEITWPPRADPLLSETEVIVGAGGAV